MLEAFNSKERELSDWEHLLAQASVSDNSEGTLKLQSVTKPFGSVMSLLEVVWQSKQTTELTLNGVANGHANGINGINGIHTNGANGNGEINGVAHFAQNGFH